MRDSTKILPSPQGAGEVARRSRRRDGGARGAAERAPSPAETEPERLCPSTASSVGSDCPPDNPGTSGERSTRHSPSPALCWGGFMPLAVSTVSSTCQLMGFGEKRDPMSITVNLTPNPSLQRRLESIPPVFGEKPDTGWTPACAGVTEHRGNNRQASVNFRRAA